MWPLGCVRGACRHPRRVWKEAERSWPAGQTWGSVTTPDPLRLRMFSGTAHFPWSSGPGDHPILTVPRVSGLHRGVCTLGVGNDFPSGTWTEVKVLNLQVIPYGGVRALVLPGSLPTTHLCHPTRERAALIHPSQKPATVLADPLPARQRDRPPGLCSYTFLVRAEPVMESWM